jgi:hypothetical protein
MPDNASAQQRGATKESRLDRAIDIFKPQPGPPPKPSAPPVDRSAWRESVEETHVVPGLTVHDVGLSVFGETRSFRDRSSSNEPIGASRQKVAHVIINGAELAHQTGKKPPSVHPPVEPKDLHNHEDYVAYDSSMHAAREAYLSGHDPTNGATHLNARRTPDRSYWKGSFPMSTQSGPYDNSFVKGDVRSHTAWINTYLPDEGEKRAHKK